MLLRNIAQASDPARKALTLLSIIMPVRPLVGPVRATIEVSTRCNFTCLMCPYYSPLANSFEQSERDFMDMTLASGVFASAAKIGAKMLSFTGRGEPLLHPDFADLIRLASRLGLQSEVFTNGSLLTKQRMEDLIDAGLSTLAVSLVGASPESWARYHPGLSPETFLRILDSLTLLQQLKRRAGAREPRLSLRFIAMEGSHLDIDKMVDLGLRLGADSIHLAPLRNRSVGDIGSADLSGDEERFALDRLKELTPRVAKAGLQTNLDEIAVFNRYGPASPLFPCYAGWFDARVLVDGTVGFCVRCSRTLGNVIERPLDEIWGDSEIQTLRGLATKPQARSKIGSCDCDRCCHFFSNWRITRFLSTFGLAPKIEFYLENDWR